MSIFNMKLSSLNDDSNNFSSVANLGVLSHPLLVKEKWSGILKHHCLFWSTPTGRVAKVGFISWVRYSLLSLEIKESLCLRRSNKVVLLQ